MERWKEDFLIGLRQGKPVDECARRLAGLPLAAVYEAREVDIEFAGLWDEARPPESDAHGVEKRPLTAQALEALMWAQCSDDETAGYFNMDVGEFKAAIASDEVLARSYKLGPLGGKAALKRAQFEKAMAGDGSMQTWVGKQVLGQSDKVDNTVIVKEDIDDEDLARRLLFLMAQGGVSPDVLEGGVVTDGPKSDTVAISDMRDGSE